MIMIIKHRESSGAHMMQYRCVKRALLATQKNVLRKQDTEIFYTTTTSVRPLTQEETAAGCSSCHSICMAFVLHTVPPPSIQQKLVQRNTVNSYKVMQELVQIRQQQLHNGTLRYKMQTHTHAYA
jgi:hypothetical protein